MKCATGLGARDKWWDRVRGAAAAQGVGWLTVQWPALVRTEIRRRGRIGSPMHPERGHPEGAGRGARKYPPRRAPPRTEQARGRTLPALLLRSDWATACGAPAAERAVREVARRRSARSPAARGRSRVAWATRAGVWGATCAKASEPVADFGRARKGLARPPPPWPTRPRFQRGPTRQEQHSLAVMSV